MNRGERHEPAAPATEYFYIDETGRKQDAGLHASMLDNSDANESQCKLAVPRQLSAGLTREEVELLFGRSARI